MWSGSHGGPVYVKDVYDVNEEDNINKAHVVLYTCATSRGIILDLVKDTSASCFVNSCIKFISRRGCPQIFLSDNGPAFKCRETQEFAALRNIEWKFSIAEAPNFGGFWERLVACVKNCLKKTIGRASLRFDELQTILNEIELTLNSRPLVPIYDDTTEKAITPNHLLFGSSLNAINNETHPNICTKELNKRYTYLEKLLKHFWERWTTEYLTSLREFQKHHQNRNRSNIPGVNEIVIIKEDKLPRQQWRLGRIVKLIESRDGNVRAAEVLVGKTGKYIERTVNRLYPLEFSNENIIDIQSPNEDRVNIKNKRQSALLADIKRKFVSY